MQRRDANPSLLPRLVLGWVAVGAPLIVLAVACGGGGEEPVGSTSAGPLLETTGSEDGAGGEEDDEDGLANLPPEPNEPEPEPEPTYGDPVELTVQLQVGSGEGTGRFVVRDIDGETVAEGDSGDTVTLPTGPYTVEATITDPDELIDTPTREDAVEVGEMTPMVVVRFPKSRVTLNIRKGGRAVRRASVSLLNRTGPGGPAPEPVAEIRDPGRPFNVSPGRYDAVIRIGNLEVPVENLVFQDGATQTVPVNVN